MTTKTEKGIAIGVVISEAHLHSYNGIPSMEVVFDANDNHMPAFLCASFGGRMYGNTWRVIGRECKRVTDDIQKYAPACQFMRDLAQWMGQHETHFAPEPRKREKKEVGEWVTDEGVLVC